MEPTTALDLLLVSNNHHTLTAVTGGLKEIGATLNFASTSEAARDFVGRRRVDGIILDLDVPGAQDLILAIRQGISNRGAVVFACLPSASQSPVALVTGATFLLQQPLTPESVASHVGAARNLMLQERCRYFRYAVHFPVVLTADRTEEQAMMTNLSEGGMAAYIVKPMEHSGMIDFNFELPTGDTIAGKGSLAWANNEGMIGIKFQFLRGQGEEILKKWLRARHPVTPQNSAPSSDRGAPGS
jgi:hypothetical protein